MRTLLSISSILILFSCNQTNKKTQKSKLQVSINTSYRKYLDDPFIQIKRGDSSYYDSIHNQSIFVFDSLRNGKINLSIFSLLTKNIGQKIDMQKDTTIVFDTSFYSSFKTINFNNFIKLKWNTNDTIFVGQKVLGCFGGSIEKILITKSSNRCSINYEGNNCKVENQNFSISDSLFEKHYLLLLKKSKKLFFPKITNGLTLINGSTTHINTYIRQGNHILEFPDFYDWDGYENFKKGIGISM